MNKFLRRVPFHPFLWAVYPILALLAFNLGQVYLWMAARSLVLSLLATTVFFVLLWLIYRDWHKHASQLAGDVLCIRSYLPKYRGCDDPEF
jgi:uncharacterized membrane protein